MICTSSVSMPAYAPVLNKWWVNLFNKNPNNWNISILGKEKTSIMLEYNSHNNSR